MKVFLINTCGGAADMVALADTAAEPQVIARRALPGRTSSEQILPALRTIFAETGLGVADLDAVVVVDGPGSFTGVRVGLSVAKGLCEGAGVRLVAISRLALLAAQADSAAAVLTLLDAGRSEFFAGLYRGGVCERETLLRRGEIDAAAIGRVVVVSEQKVAEALSNLVIQLLPEPDADVLLRLGMARIAANLWTDVATADANYQRRTDAELLVERQTAARP